MVQKLGVYPEIKSSFQDRLIALWGVGGGEIPSPVLAWMAQSNAVCTEMVIAGTINRSRSLIGFPDCITPITCFACLFCDQDDPTQSGEKQLSHDQWSVRQNCRSLLNRIVSEECSSFGSSVLLVVAQGLPTQMILSNYSYFIYSFSGDEKQLPKRHTQNNPQHERTIPAMYKPFGTKSAMWKVKMHILYLGQKLYSRGQGGIPFTISHKMERSEMYTSDSSSESSSDTRHVQEW